MVSVVSASLSGAITVVDKSYYDEIFNLIFLLIGYWWNNT